MLYSNNHTDPFDGGRHDQPLRTSSRVVSGMYIYELHVIQQPMRARMCGFGEKDRRPCTPPPILQLVIYDRSTGQLVDIDHIDVSFFTATCSLFSADMDVEMDLIRQRAPNDSGHGSTAILPAIQRPLQSADSAAGDGLHQGASTDSGMQLPPLAEIGAGMSSARTTVRNDARRASDFAHDPKEMTLGQNAASSSSIMSFSAGDNNPVQEADDTALCIVRNLIGSSVTAGQKLQNIDGLQGIFFVFPDLSIRKDGEYRLRFSFFNLQGEDGELMTSVTQIKAHTFSEPFRVYSAKQFPGMIESTVLSKHFAKQGVKIPVRKESGKGGEFET